MKTRNGFLLVLLVGMWVLSACNRNDSDDDSNIDFTLEIQGRFEGSLSIDYSDFPGDNVAESSIASISRLANDRVLINMQGGNSLESTLDGSDDFTFLVDVANPRGRFTGATDISGTYSLANEDIDFTVTGNYSKGGTFEARFIGSE